MIFENKILNNKDAFLSKVKEVAKKLGIAPDWLMASMYLESGFRHDIVNEIGAVGLIQFVPSTYAELGHTESSLKNMANYQQLDVVYTYLNNQNRVANKGKKIKNFVDFHTLIFFPAAINIKGKQVFQTSSLSAQTVANRNRTVDLNKDGKITKNEFAEYIYNRLIDSGLKKGEVNKLMGKGAYSQKNQLFLFGSVALLGFILYICTKKL